MVLIMEKIAVISTRADELSTKIWDTFLLVNSGESELKSNCFN